MITAAELCENFTRLNIEFRKNTDVAEAMRWILHTVEFIETLSHEMLDMYGVTEEEKVDIRHSCFSLQGIREDITGLYQKRTEKEDKQP